MIAVIEWRIDINSILMLMLMIGGAVYRLGIWVRKTDESPATVNQDIKYMREKIEGLEADLHEYRSQQQQAHERLHSKLNDTHAMVLSQITAISTSHVRVPEFAQFTRRMEAFESRVLSALSHRGKP